MLSVIVPCYNEEKNLPFLIRRFEKAFGKKQTEIELVLVNNGSTDNSKEVLKKIKAEYKFVRIVTVPKNIGYGYGIFTGLKSAKGEMLAFTHADMQCDPLDVLNAYRVLKNSTYKVLVKGNRKGRFSILTSIFHLLSLLLFFRRFDDINGQPKVFDRSLLKLIKNPPYEFEFDFYVQYKAIKNGYKIKSIPVKFRERKFGYSKWSTTFASRFKNVTKFTSYLIKLRLFGEN